VQLFFSEGVVGDWRGHFTPEQNVKFDAGKGGGGREEGKGGGV